MREHELEQLLGGLATRLDEATEPVDIDMVLQAPRRRGSPGRRSLYLLSVAALVALVAGATWAWPAPEEETPEVLSGSRPTIELVRVSGPVKDGAVVQVTGTGFRPGREVAIRQCSADGCDEWRPPTRVTTDADGRFATRVVVYHDIATGRGTAPRAPVNPAWRACDACVLQADGDSVAAEVPLDLAATEEPSHPTLTVTPAPGYAADDPFVLVRGTGFRPDAEGLDVGITYCAADAQRSEECGGGPALGDFGITSDGVFTVEAMALPAADTVLGGTRCADRAGACVLTWFLQSPGPLPAGVPIDISGEGS